jgi:hypothetical protein
MKNAWVLLTAIVASAMMPGVVLGQSCYDSTITRPTPFMGNDGEIFRLDDGSTWEVKYEYEYLYEYYPSVTICPGQGVLILGEKALNVQRIDTGNRPSSPQPQARSAQPGRSHQLEVIGDDDFSFYDSRGRATAYFELSDELIFYLWT